ncbi:MAG: hypothetical protein Q8O68_01340, partial [Candidatus Daviesbacteria bacterium]|nr:hypothetical protein [Candidatus Daviesbacteria bacterium]
MGPVVNEQPKSEQSSKKQIIKIIFVFVVIVLVFAVLSYLNIIPNKSSKQDNKPTTITSAIKYSSSTFQYDPQKAEKMLTQYIKDTIKPEFLPAKIEVKQGLSIDGRTEDVKYEFGSMFNSIDSSISANFHYKEY